MNSTREKLFILLALLCLAYNQTAFAQAGAGATGITAATNEVKSYFPYVKTLVWMIGGVVGLVSGVRIFTKWNNGDRDINKEIMAFVGSLIFVVIMPTVLQSFFNI